MPEIKNTFIQGKMNKDLDERLLPNGEYRDAMNVQVTTSEGSEVGTVQNILGNERIDTGSGISSDFKCVGSITDEKNDAIYWFVTDKINNIDAILEYKKDLNVSPIFIDTTSSVLKFPNRIITGINIIDDFLFWTDNVNEPRKISISRSKKGTNSTITNPINTKLVVNNKIVSNDFVDAADGAVTNSSTLIVHDASKFQVGMILSGISLAFGPLIIIPPNTTVDSINSNTITLSNNITCADGVDITFTSQTDVTEDHITVIKNKPMSPPSVKINSTPASPTSSLFEKTLCRFSLRYKYEDGEYSAFGPFTDIVFNPTFPDEVDSDSMLSVKEPYNKAMVSSIDSIDVYDFISPNMPKDVVQVDILYKQENSPVVYSIASIKQNDPIPSGYQYNYWNDLGFNQDSIFTNSGYKGKYPIASENIYAAVPSNQLLRPWDNVPKKALAQEVTGSRVVYGNYTQNYNVPFTPSLNVNYENRDKYKIPDFSLGGVPSLKSQRTYQLGVVFGDKYGRETPVYTSTEGAVKIPWENGGVLSASQSYQLTTHLDSTMPNWADYYKFYIKETSTEYYNLVMDKAYAPTADKTEVDGVSEETDHIWVSFSSSDRNKLTEESYIILKKKIKPGVGQFEIKNRFKILDIKNEVPDAIKFNYVTLGAHFNKASGSYSGILDNGGGVGIEDVGFNDGIYVDPIHRMDIDGGRVIWIDKSNFEKSITGDGASLLTGDDAASDVRNIYISWSDQETLQASKRYRIANTRISNPGASAVYVLTLEESITTDDAALAVHPTIPQKINEDLAVKLERKDTKDMDQFSGRFFVKLISQEDTTAGLRNVHIELLDTFAVGGNQDILWWAEPENTTDDDPTTGIINSNAYNSFLPNTTQSTTGQNLEDINLGTLTTSTSSAAGTYANNVTNWDNLADPHVGLSTKVTGGLFFIDGLTFVAGQCADNYFARNAGDPIRGNTTIYGQMEWSNALDTSRLAPPFTGVYATFGPWGTTPTQWMQNPQKINYYPYVNSGQPVWNVFTQGGNYAHQVHIKTTWGSGNQTGIEAPYTANEGYSTEFYRTVAGGTYRWKPFSKDASAGFITELGSPGNTSRGYLVKNYSGANATMTDDRSWTLNSMGLADPNGINPGAFVHAIDAIVKTSDEHTALDGIKRWRAEGELNTGSWNQDNTYGNGAGDNDKIYLHVSFLAPGESLLPDSITPSQIASCDLKGLYNLGTKLQGIWGGGIFTKEDGSIIANNSWKARILECEGNYTSDSGGSSSSNWFTYGAVPGPGNGQGYDTNYTDHHNNQWDPAWPVGTDSGGGIAAFVNSIQRNNQFYFKADPDQVFYTIRSWTKKHLYNHTPWRRRKVWNSGAGELVFSGDSVEEAAIEWGKRKGVAGSVTTVGSELYYANILAEKLINFAKPSNRRVVYILELDKDPTDPSVSTFNPVNSVNLDAGVELDGTGTTGMEFIQTNPRSITGRVSTTPAVWETEPKTTVDLDIYYEASGTIPCNLNETNAELFAPIGCKIKFESFPDAINSGITIDAEEVYLSNWTLDNSSLLFTASPGFNDLDSGGSVIDYTGKKVKFIKKDGSYTTGTILANNTTAVGDYRTHFEIDPSVDPNNNIGLSWYNCFSFGNGVESDRIRDDFNEMQMLNGARASTTTEEPYQEETRKYGLIFSGLYNSNSGLNDLNQFIMAEKITKDLNPTYGSIQKLFSRNTDLVTFCEDRVIKILANKDAVFNADGKPQLTANINVLGQTMPFVGDFGISKNPESFAKESYRAYFTDKARGAVLRLSSDGLTPISDAGMHDWFRDNFRLAGSLIGTYDEYKKNYNLTLRELATENVIVNADISQGEEMESNVIPTNEFISNTTPTGSSLNYAGIVPFLPLDNASDTYAGIVNPILNTQPVISEYPKITQGQFQQALSIGATVQSGNYVINGNFSAGQLYQWSPEAGWNWNNFSIFNPPNPLSSFMSGFASVTVPTTLAGPGSPTYLWSNSQGGGSGGDNMSGDILLGVEYTFTCVIDNVVPSAGTFAATGGEIEVQVVGETGAGYAADRQHYMWLPKFELLNLTGGPHTLSHTFTMTAQPNAATTVGSSAYNPNTFFIWIRGDGITLDISDISITESITALDSIPDIPDAEIPAWSRISTNITDWNPSSTGSTLTFENSLIQYGPTYDAVLTTAIDGQTIDANGNAINDGNTYSWYTPNPNNVIFHSDDPNNLTPGTPVGYATPTEVFDYSNFTFTPVSTQPLLDDTIGLDCTSAPNGIITFTNVLDTNINDMEVGSWYVLDVVYGAVTSTTEIISIEGVLDANVAASLNPGGSGYPEGHLGTTLGSGEIQLVSTYPDSTFITKQYYDSPNESDTVYRTIFKLASLTDMNLLALKFKDFIGEVKGIWLSKLDTLPSGGSIDAGWVSGGLDKYLWWDITSFTQQLATQLHSLILPEKYFKDGKFNFFKSSQGSLSEDFSVVPLASSEGYQLLFTLEEAVEQTGLNTVPIDNAFYGYVTGEDGVEFDPINNPGEFSKTGFKFESNLNPPAGQYRVLGNFDKVGPYSVEIKDNTGTWVTSTNFTVDDYETIAGSAPNFASKIHFAPLASKFTGAIKNIQFGDTTIVLSGGIANAWSFTGFDSAIYNYITFDNETILFTNAPVTGSGGNTVQVEQDLTNTINPDVGDEYRVKFEYNLSGTLAGYYFNNNGRGFRISGITGSGTYNQVLTIDNTVTQSGTELLNTFVLYVDSGPVSGTIDDVLMQRVFTTPFETTVSFTETVRGWTSFKSFIPESGVSMSKKYYTMREGGLWEHHSPNADRNNFYNANGHSTITTVLNKMPSSIKIFNTLNYEGSQSKIQKYHTSYEDSATPYNIEAKPGWYVDYLKTDKQEGTIKEFIEKEGKWFNYIRGRTGDVETSAFSFQGLGTVFSQDYTILNETFDTDINEWTVKVGAEDFTNASWVSPGEMQIVGGSPTIGDHGVMVREVTGLIPGEDYIFSYECTSGSKNFAHLYDATSTVAANIGGNLVGIHTHTFTASYASINIHLGVQGQAASYTANFDNVSVTRTI